jgi:hypothetical protein
MPSPRVIIREGYPMMEDANGGWRHIDRETDAEFLRELEIRLPAETMGQIREAFGLLDPAPRTPAQLIAARLLLKNFTNDGKLAQEYVKALPGEWEVRQLGDNPWNFAVSRDKVNWHLFDPGPTARARGFGVVDVAQEAALDLLDLTTDALIGSASAAAFTLGAGGTSPTGLGAIAAGSLAGGVTATGLEGVKQVIGQVAGIEGNVDIPDAAAIGILTTIFGGAGPAAARTIRAAGRQVKKFAGGQVGQALRETVLEGMSGLVGVGSSAPVRPEEILERRIKDPAKIFERIPSMDDTAAAMRNLVKGLSRQEIPEQPIANAIEKEAAEAGVTVNVRKIIDEFLDPLTTRRAAAEVADPTKTATARIKLAPPKSASPGRAKSKTVEGSLKRASTDENIPRRVEELIENVEEQMALQGVNSRAVPVDFAVRMKRPPQARARERGAIRTAATATGKKAAENVTQFDKILNEFQGVLRKRVASSIDDVGFKAPDGRTYSQTMSDFGRKMKQLDLWKFHLGTELSEEEGIKHAAGFIRNLHRIGQGGFRESAESLRATTGIDLWGHAQRALTSELFGRQGVSKIFPRIAAMGEPVGVGLGKRIVQSPAVMAGAIGLGSGGLGLIGGMNPVTAGIGGLFLGGTMASEAGALGLARHGVPAAKKFVGGTANLLARGLATTRRRESLATIQAIGRQIQASRGVESAGPATVEALDEFDRRQKELQGAAP